MRAKKISLKSVSQDVTIITMSYTETKKDAHAHKNYINFGAL